MYNAYHLLLAIYTLTDKGLIEQIIEF